MTGSENKIEFKHSGEFDGGSIKSTLVLQGQQFAIDQIIEGDVSIGEILEASHSHAIDAHLNPALQFILTRAAENPSNKGTGAETEYDENVELNVCGIKINLDIHVTLQNGLDSDTIRAAIVETTVPDLLKRCIKLISHTRRFNADKDNRHSLGIRPFTECPVGGSGQVDGGFGIDIIELIEVIAVDSGDPSPFDLFDPFRGFGRRGDPIG